MSILKVRKYGDNVLRTPSKEVAKISSKIQKLVDDMIDTMYAENGVGLAAPQVGENLRIFVIDVAGEKEPYNPIVFINPKIVHKSGAVSSYEGCLSFPGAYADVRRFANITIRARDIKGKPFSMEAKNGTLLARAIQHEYDHLEGILFVDHSRNRFSADQQLIEKGLAPIDSQYLLDEAELESSIQEIEALEKIEKAKAGTEENKEAESFCEAVEG